MYLNCARNDAFEKIEKKSASYHDEPSRRSLKKAREVERNNARKGKTFGRYS